MPKPQQRVIVYRNGLRKKTSAQYNDEWRLRQPGVFECPECGRPVKKGAQGNLKRHYSDCAGKIHCPAGIDPQSPGPKAGVKRGKYKPRQAKRVVDVDRKSVDTLL